MNEAFRHLHMQPELACEFLATFSRAEYALKATIQFALGDADGVKAGWDGFAEAIDKSFCAVEDEEFKGAVNYLLSRPPRKQVLENGAVRFADQVIDKKQPVAQQVLLMVRTVRNNLFHGGKHLPLGEHEPGRNERLVSASIAILRYSTRMHDVVRHHYEN